MTKTIVRAILIELLVNAISIVCIYFLWNAVIPDLIMAKEITLLQALILKALIHCCAGNRNHDKK